ncbi:MAG: hypothetical protein LBT43_13475 [Prevotella sp.]|jgi:hypothetical protein|nr:hypothetical protein [Prevotella sp.]
MKGEIITFAFDNPDSNGCGGINGYHIIRGFNAHVDINNDPNSYFWEKFFRQYISILNLLHKILNLVLCIWGATKMFSFNVVTE